MSHLSTGLAALTCCAAVSAQICPERNLGAPVGGGDEAVFAASIGFAFPFAGATYTDLHICTNGYLQLSNGGVPAPSASDYTPTQAELQSGSPRICAMWCDLNVVAANGGQIYVDNQPGRCVVTWDNAVNYGLTTPFQLQVQLSASGEIDFYWSEGAVNDSGYNAAGGHGIVGVSPGQGATLPAPSDLTTVLSTTDDSLFEEWLVQGYSDVAGYNLHLIPSGPGWISIPSPQGGCAASHAYGTGCLNTPDSFYELMSAATFDLSGATITLQRGATGYHATDAIAGTYVAPSLTAQIIANADDTVQTVTLASPMPVAGGGTTSFLTVSSNGNVALAGTGNGAGFAPDAGLFLGFAQNAFAPAWHDYNPALAGSGKIKFEQAGGIAYLTWEDVYTYGTTTSDRFQVQFDLATGDITTVYDVMGGAGAQYLVGYSCAGATWRPEAKDLSVALSTGVDVGDVAVQGLTLAGDGLPLLGSNTFALATSAAPNVVPIGLVFFGSGQLPAIDLGVIGMPGCHGYTTAELLTASFSLSLPLGAGSFPLPVPNSAPLIGAVLTAQSAAFSLQTPLNVVVSNGLFIELGV
ncbi:MAG: hypothetical protein H6835_17300 [Planctomycetes bacterium]|nr:hypothetical protein [Planctomycetota bacterium]